MGWGFEGARLIKTGENTMLTVFIKEKSMNRIVLLAVCKHIGIDPIAIKNNKNILIFCVEVSMHNKRKIYFQFIRYDIFFFINKYSLLYFRIESNRNIKGNEEEINYQC